MLDHKTLKNQVISRRAFLIGAGKLGLLSLLTCRMFYMQLIKQDEYKTLSDKNRISLVLLPPPRGPIYDIAGNTIATNRPCFRLLLDKTNTKNYQSELNLISEILALTAEEQANIVQKIGRANKRLPIMIVDQLSWPQIAIIEERKPELSSIFIDINQARSYPYGISTSHLVGYTGQVNEQELKELRLRNRDFNIGKSGIEKYYESILRGEFGYKQMEVNAFGKYIRELSSLDSKEGNSLHLNIDIELQNKIWPYLNRQGCSAIAMDCTNGNIIILASSPGFEPNNFTKLSSEYWQSLINDSYKPLINKTIQNAYPPGSPFKIITVLAALEAGILPDKKVVCVGGATALGDGFRCHSKVGHGHMNMFDAIKYSCNTYMYEISRQIGPDKIIEVARKFGFGVQTGIDLPGEVSGLIPSRSWKKDRFKSNWSLGDTLNLSIGQGFLLASPVQLVRFINAIANDGKLYKPIIAKGESVFTQIDINQEHLNIIKEALYNAVNTVGGSAYNSRIQDQVYAFAGKTGTAQVQSKANAKDDLSRESIAWARRNHAVFVGFGPYHNPRFSVAVFVDHGGGGGRAAAPIASRIISELLAKYEA
jgi:penicillin-binding protein 2